MATTAEIDYVCRVIESQGMRRMEATEAGADGLKIDYLEGTAQEISERVRDLQGSVRGMFLVRCWNDDAPHDRPGKKSPKSAPFTWRLQGAGGAAPAMGMVTEKLVERNMSEAERELMELRAKLDRQELEFRHRMELNAIEAADTEQPEMDEEPEPVVTSRHIDRAMDLAERLLDRFAPRKAANPAPIQGIQTPTDELEELILAIERFRADDPKQYEAIKKTLLAQYGGTPKADG